jgi:hypothetical protein
MYEFDIVYAYLDGESQRENKETEGKIQKTR